jgi:RNA polymerase sigma-70 factor (ECF subfamily)
MSASTQGCPSSGSDKPSIDTELVIRAQAGDADAFGRLYVQLYNPICKFLIDMVGNEGVGCELTQETFLRAWLALPKLRDVTAFVSWLYQIAKNIAYDYLRRYRNVRLEGSYEELESIESVSVAGPEEEIEAKEHLMEALAHIKWKYRACLLLYHKENYSISQIASLVGIQESSVKTYISNGIKTLQDFLKEDDTSAKGG